MSNGKLPLHGKLNNLIQPLLKQLKTQQIEFNQITICNIITCDLLPCLDNLQKNKALDAIVKMFMKGLASHQLVIGDKMAEVDQGLLGNVELRAWETILKSLLDRNGPDYLLTSGISNQILSFIRQDLKGKSG